MSDFKILIGDDFSGMSAEEIRAYYDGMTIEQKAEHKAEQDRRWKEEARIRKKKYAAKRVVINEYYDSFNKVLTLTEEDKLHLFEGTHPRFRFKSGYNRYGAGHKLSAKHLDWKFHPDETYTANVTFTDGHSTFTVTLRAEDNPHKDAIKPWLNMPDEIKPKWGDDIIPKEYKRFSVSEPEHTTYALYTVYARDEDHLQVLLDNGILDDMDSEDRESGYSNDKVTFNEDTSW